MIEKKDIMKIKAGSNDVFPIESDGTPSVIRTLCYQINAMRKKPHPVRYRVQTHIDKGIVIVFGESKEMKS